MHCNLIEIYYALDSVLVLVDGPEKCFPFFVPEVRSSSRNDNGLARSASKPKFIFCQEDPEIGNSSG